MDCFMLFLFVWPVLETSSTGRMHCKAEQVNQRAWKDKTMDTSWAFSKVIRKRDMAASTPSLTGFNSVRPLLFYWLPAVAYWMSFDQRSLWWLPFWWTYFSIGFFFSMASSLVACSYPIRVCVLLVCDRLACLLAINWGCSLPLAWAPLIPSWVYFLSSLFYVVMSWIRSIPYNFVHSYLLSYSYSVFESLRSGNYEIIYVHWVHHACLRAGNFSLRSILARYVFLIFYYYYIDLWYWCCCHETVPFEVVLLSLFPFIFSNLNAFHKIVHSQSQYPVFDWIISACTTW